MTRLGVLIVDDEPLAREGVRNHVKKEPDLEVVGEAGDGSEAVALIEELRPDVVFLDVQMPEMDGFAVLEALGADEMPAIVFVTAYERYAVRAFEAHAVDYLLKPFDRDRFSATVARLRERLSRSESFPELGELMRTVRKERRASRIVVKRAGRIALVPVHQIEWIEAAGNYVYLHTPAGRHLVRDSLLNLEQELDPDEFVRIHRSTIVRMDAITELERIGGGDFAVYLESGRELTLSRSFRRDFERRLGRTL